MNTSRFYLILSLCFISIVILGQDITSIEYITGKFDPATHSDFTEIPIKYTDQKGRLMRKDALAAFISMADEASKTGIKLVIKSATRNFQYQKRIWENKWNGNTKLEDNSKASDINDPKNRALKILLYSSMPGTSRHHWGTDIDINSFNNEWFTKGEGKKLYKWMTTHAHKYGFCQVYSAKGKFRSKGYNEEKWHWSYMPIANKILAESKLIFKNILIKDFLGAETAESIDMKKNYMEGISIDCEPPQGHQ